MSLYEFVFSEKTPNRYIRHVIFWLAWSTYFYISLNSLPAQTNAAPPPDYSITNFSGTLHFILIVLIHLLACYSFIYFILPRYLLKAKYFSFLVAIAVLGFAMVQLNRIVDTSVTLLTNDSSEISVPYYFAVFTGLISAIKVIALASVIKLVKHWWLKQKEKERLEKEKIEAELQLLKAQIHPQLLFNTLNNIYEFALTASPNAPVMLIKLSDILSYMLYECNERLVLVEKEIKILKDYMSLEKSRYSDRLEMNIQVIGDLKDKKIAPLLLLRFIENSFRLCSNQMTEQPWINLEIVVEKQVLEMKLMNGKPAQLPPLEDGEEDNLAQAKKRLQLLYPESHELKIIEEPEIMMVILRVDLEQNHKDVLSQKKSKSEALSLETS